MPHLNIRIYLNVGSSISELLNEPVIVEETQWGKWLRYELKQVHFEALNVNWSKIGNSNEEL